MAFTSRSHRVGGLGAGSGTAASVCPHPYQVLARPHPHKTHTDSSVGHTRVVSSASRACALACQCVAAVTRTQRSTPLRSVWRCACHSHSHHHCHCSTHQSWTSSARGDPPVQVGPGSYSQSSHAAEHGYAPFSSTSARPLHAGATTSSAFTPGPGYYNAGAVASGAARAGAHATADVGVPFSCTSAKFAVDRSTAAAAPGPGHYAPAESWIKSTHHRCAGRNLSPCATRWHTSALDVRCATPPWGRTRGGGTQQ